MAIPTEQEWHDGKTDLDAVEACVNSTELTFNTRLGGTKPTLTGILYSAARGDINPYSDVTIYTAIDEWVEVSGVVYRPIPSFLPIGPEAFTSSKWAVAQISEASNISYDNNGTPTNVQNFLSFKEVADYATARANLAAGVYKAGDKFWIDEFADPWQVQSGTELSANDNGFVLVATGGGAYAINTAKTMLISHFEGDLAAAVAYGANRELYLDMPSINLPSSPVDINSSMRIFGPTQNSVTLQKTATVGGIRVLASNVTLEHFKINGELVGDTSYGIRIGENDGANGQGAGYISAAQCTLRQVFAFECGDYNIDWEEGPFLSLLDVHSFNANVNNFYVSEDSFDASHGVWQTNSAGAGDDGHSIQWGVHTFEHVKSFADAGVGVYLDQSRGTRGNIFVELSGGACLEYGANTLSNRINVMFKTATKDVVDAGIGNDHEGMSRGDNNGPIFNHFVRTSNLLIQNEQILNGGTRYNGGLLINQTSDNDFNFGNSAYVCKLNATAAGVALKGMASHSKIFDMTGLGTVALSDTNQHISDWLVSTGETLQLNGAGGTAYTPFDGQTVTVWLKGAGTASIYGQIGGSLTTETITTANTSKTYVYQAAQGYWFVRT